MGMRVVGAGLPRTDTMSLKAALERLLGAPSEARRASEERGTTGRS
jgi:hypothetical protein